VTSCDLAGRNLLRWNSSHLFPSLKAFLLPLFKVRRLLLVRSHPQFLSPLPFLTSFSCAAYSCILETEAGDSSETLVHGVTSLNSFLAPLRWLHSYGHRAVRESAWKPHSTAQAKVKLPLCLNPLCTMPWRRMGCSDIGPPFLNSALNGGEWSASRPQYPLDMRLGGAQSWYGRTPWREKNLGSNPGRPARSSFLYRLSYPSSLSTLWSKHTPHCSKAIMHTQNQCRERTNTTVRNITIRKYTTGTLIILKINSWPQSHVELCRPTNGPARVCSQPQLFLYM
jgi:hypothetical protein